MTLTAVPRASLRPASVREPVSASHRPFLGGSARPKCCSELRHQGCHLIPASLFLPWGPCFCFQYLGGPLPCPAGLGIIQAPACPRADLRTVSVERAVGPIPGQRGPKLQHGARKPTSPEPTGGSWAQRSNLTEPLTVEIRLDIAEAYFPH